MPRSPGPGRCRGTPGLEHRVGGIEKADIRGTISYDLDNHDAMVRLRQAKVDGIAASIAPWRSTTRRRRAHAHPAPVEREDLESLDRGRFVD